MNIWPRWIADRMNRAHIRAAQYHLDRAAVWLGHREAGNGALRKWLAEVLRKWGERINDDKGDR